MPFGSMLVGAHITCMPHARMHERAPMSMHACMRACLHTYMQTYVYSHGQMKTNIRLLKHEFGLLTIALVFRARRGVVRVHAHMTSSSRRERDRERERGSVRVCVWCVCVSVCRCVRQLNKVDETEQTATMDNALLELPSWSYSSHTVSLLFLFFSYFVYDACCSSFFVI